jgi:hypothetical protein
MDRSRSQYLVLSILKSGVGKKGDELGKNRDIPELEGMDQQSEGMLEHLNGFGIAQGFAMETG